MRIVLGASLTFGGMKVHLDELYAGERIIDESNVFFLELATGHGGGLGLG